MISKIEKVRVSIIALICVAIAGYALYEARNIIAGPVIFVDEPTNGATTRQSLLEVRGRTKNISSITLNDRPITVDESGIFKEEITLTTGYNVAKVSGQDRFGRQKEILVEIIREESLDGLVTR
ncbi:MAG: hypothetical protein AAB726_01365 [Patescibacteria group bacterium]